MPMQQSHEVIKSYGAFCPLSSFILQRTSLPLIMTLQKYTFFLITAKLFFRKLIISYPKKCILRELILEKVYDLTFVIIEKVYSRADPFAKTPKAVVGLISQQLLFLLQITTIRCSNEFESVVKK